MLLLKQTPTHTHYTFIRNTQINTLSSLTHATRIKKVVLPVEDSLVPSLLLVDHSKDLNLVHLVPHLLVDLVRGLELLHLVPLLPESGVQEPQCLLQTIRKHLIRQNIYRYVRCPLLFLGSLHLLHHLVLPLVLDPLLLDVLHLDLHPVRVIAPLGHHLLQLGHHSVLVADVPHLQVVTESNPEIKLETDI